VLFRANTIADAGTLFSHLFRGLNPVHLMTYLESMGITPSTLATILVLLFFLVLFDWANRHGDGMARFKRLPAAARYFTYYGAGLFLLLRTLSTFGQPVADFIYFQF
jgi:hypothetical protein